MKSLHIICAKCGSTDLRVRIKRELGEYIGVNFCCDDCGTLTSVEEIKEQIDEERAMKK